jgi:hypothetical protein
VLYEGEDALNEKDASIYLGKNSTYLTQRRHKGSPVPPYVEGSSPKNGKTCNLYKTSDLDVWKVENERLEDALSEIDASIYLGKNKVYLTQRRRKGLPVPPYVEGSSPKNGKLCNLYKTSDLDAWKVENERFENYLTEEQASIYLGKSANYLIYKRRKGLPVPPYVESKSSKNGKLCNLYKTSDLDVWKMENERLEDELSEMDASVYLGKNSDYLSKKRRNGSPVPPYVEGKSPKNGIPCNLYKTSDLDKWKVENERDGSE